MEAVQVNITPIIILLPHLKFIKTKFQDALVLQTPLITTTVNEIHFNRVPTLYSLSADNLRSTRKKNCCIVDNIISRIDSRVSF